MQELTAAATDVRVHLTRIAHQVACGGDRFVMMNHGYDSVAIVSMEDLDFLRKHRPLRERPAGAEAPSRGPAHPPATEQPLAAAAVTAATEQPLAAANAVVVAANDDGMVPRRRVVTFLKPAPLQPRQTVADRREQERAAKRAAKEAARIAAEEEERKDREFWARWRKHPEDIETKALIAQYLESHEYDHYTINDWRCKAWLILKLRGEPIAKTLGPYDSMVESPASGGANAEG